jgi:hypothetical protein
LGVGPAVSSLFLPFMANETRVFGVLIACLLRKFVVNNRVVRKTSPYSHLQINSVPCKKSTGMQKLGVSCSGRQPTAFVNPYSFFFSNGLDLKLKYRI